MKKYVFLLIVTVFAYVSCASGQKTEAPIVQSSMSPQLVKAQNDQLDKVPVGGFEYKGSNVPAQKWDKWSKAAAPIVKEIIAKLPQGYVLEIAGHTDARGPEQADGDKKGNIAISEERANSVLASLKKAGITSDRIRAKGYGSSKPLEGVDTKDNAQRRVTFQVVEQ